MSLRFMSLRSSSSGNCLLIRTDRTSVLIDCGLGSMKRTRRVLSQSLGDQLDIDAAVISHMHTDHIGYYSLRVLESLGVDVRVHESCLPQLEAKHLSGRGLNSLRLKPFSDAGFHVGDLNFGPFEVPHNPWYPTCGFVITHGRSKLVVATDFNKWDALLQNFVDADFVFVECNHDLHLLALHFNPNSRFHMPNPDTADLLCAARRSSSKPPQATMLGHLSEIRNRPDLAIREVKDSFERADVDLDFPLLVAPRAEQSQVVEVNRTARVAVATYKSRGTTTS